MVVLITPLRRKEAVVQKLHDGGWEPVEKDGVIEARHPDVDGTRAARAKLGEINLLTDSSVRIEFPSFAIA